MFEERKVKVHTSEELHSRQQDTAPLKHKIELVNEVVMLKHIFN